MLDGYRIALIEDDDIMGASLVQRLELEGASVVWMKQINRAIGALRTPKGRIDAVVCDIRLPDGNGEELFNVLLKTSSPPPFLFITGHGGIEQAVRLMQAGAADYITKPFDTSVFLERLATLLFRSGDHELPPLLGVSPAARRIDQLVTDAAAADKPVLIRGGPGTGKERVAKRIHELSDRRAAPFVSINLARDPDICRSLFHPGGATDAVGEGILFLNALSRMPMDAQDMLLNVLEREKFQGRVIAACGIDLPSVVSRKGMNPDLFSRLDGFEIAIPPLGDRPEDAVWLMRQLFDSVNARRARPLRGISRLAEEDIRLHDWPGGGRELRARLVKGVNGATGALLLPVDLFPERVARGTRIMTLAEARSRAERRQIIEALERTGGQLGTAAKLLRVSRTTLWEKMQKLDLKWDGP